LSDDRKEQTRQFPAGGEVTRPTAELEAPRPEAEAMAPPRGTISPAPTAEEGVVVIGLTRFGGQVAITLLRLEHEVLGIDNDPRLVQLWSNRLTYVTQADPTNNDALRQLGVQEYRRAVVGIDSSLETSVLTVVALSEIGVREIWAKAINAKHGKILSRVGASHVVYPEAAMGDRVAHLITSKMLDFIELDEGFAIAKVYAPQEVTAQPLSAAELRKRYGVAVVGVREPDGRFAYIHPDAPIGAGSLLIVSGTTDQVERFAALPNT
jgi:trk system potassium uptake protein TrkA